MHIVLTVFSKPFIARSVGFAAAIFTINKRFWVSLSNQHEIVIYSDPHYAFLSFLQIIQLIMNMQHIEGSNHEIMRHGIYQETALSCEN